jgi:tetrahydromethanopterin S-methyltransferase subunit E
MVCPICTGVGVNAIVSGGAAIATTIGGIVASKKVKSPPLIGGISKQVKSPPPSKNKNKKKSKRDSK